MAHFDEYQLEDWWRENGSLRDFVEELQKPVFYLVKVHIPLKLSYCTEKALGPVFSPSLA